MLEATPKATQYNTKWGRKVFEEWQQRRQNKCAMSGVVEVVGLKCGDVQDLTVSVKHMSPNMLNVWLSKFFREAGQVKWRALSAQFALFVNLCF